MDGAAGEHCTWVCGDVALIACGKLFRMPLTPRVRSSFICILFPVRPRRTDAPALAPSDVVVMDNLSAHKVAGIAQAIAAAGASILYLPAYSPDLNPIEQLFAKLKALLRKAAARARDELWDVIGSLLDAFTPAECRNYLENAGYAFT